MHTFTSLNWNSDDENANRVLQERKKAAMKLKKAREKAEKDRFEQEKRRSKMTPRPSQKLSTRLTKAKPSEDPLLSHKLRYKTSRYRNTHENYDNQKLNLII